MIKKKHIKLKEKKIIREKSKVYRERNVKNKSEKNASKIF